MKLTVITGHFQRRPPATNYISPIVEAARVGRSLLIPTCVYCREPHSHGTGTRTDVCGFFGHRIAHCWHRDTQPNTGYEILVPCEPQRQRELIEAYRRAVRRRPRRTPVRARRRPR